MTLPYARKREKIKPLQRDTVRGPVVVLQAEVTGGIKSRTGERRFHTARWLVNDHGSSMASCFCVSVKMQRPDPLNGMVLHSFTGMCCCSGHWDTAASKAAENLVSH